MIRIVRSDIFRFLIVCLLLLPACCCIHAIISTLPLLLPSSWPWLLHTLWLLLLTTRCCIHTIKSNMLRQPSSLLLHTLCLLLLTNR